MQYKRDSLELPHLFGAMAKLFDIVFIMKFRKDKRFEYIQFSDTAKQLANLSDHALGQSIQDVYNGEVATWLHDQYTHAISSGQPVQFIDQMNLKESDEIRRAETTLIPFDINDEQYVIAFTKDVTELEMKKNEVTEQKERFHSLFAYNNDAIIATDVFGNIQMVNEAFINHFSMIENQVINQNIYELFLSLAIFKGESTTSPIEEEVLLELSHKSLIALVKRIPIIVNERSLGFYYILKDITAEREIIVNNKEVEDRYKRLIELSPQMIVLVKGDEVNFVNKAGMQLLETTEEEIVGEKISSFIKEEIGSFLKDGDVATINTPNGKLLYVTLKKSDVFLNKEKITLYSCTDITNQLAIKEELVFLEHYDSLTGLYNRKSLDKVIDSQISSREPFHFILFDIDKFKLVNDLLGTANADLVFIEFANRLKSLIGSDFIGRINGDEFVVILPGDQSINSFIVEVQEVLNNHFETDQGPIHITASISISNYPNHGSNAEQLYLNSMKAMTLAKIQGARQVIYYSHEMQEFFARKYKIESELQISLKQNHFHVAYQPKIHLKGKPIELEALIRWVHPSMGMISPAEFIPIAEESGLIIDLGKFVIKQVCTDLKELQKNYPELRVAINLSPKQFLDPALEDCIIKAINESGLDPKFIEFEITETTLMTDPNKAVYILNSLKKSGITIAIDDFGTSFSSFTYLKKLPVDSIKIDRSFISGIAENEKDGKLVEGLIELAHKMKLSITAEGVETLEQLEFLRAKECDIVQGFYFGRPEKLELLIKTLERLNK
ncbi:MAG: EAL domain-containing protein [Anaerobacillus sp.]|uniref:EAL domain-containing protein n=1 Tax=Anaerobacillus sp. TaxID=1872506 RepID=UPI00391C2AC7